MNKDQIESFSDAETLYANGQLVDCKLVLEPLVSRLAGDGLPTFDQAKPLELLGLVQHDLGKPFEAADCLEKASLVAPISDRARIALASSYAELQRIDLARELYLQLALSRRLSPTLMLEVAAGLEAIDSPHLAMQVCEWITESDEENAQAYFDMGRYSSSSGNALYISEALTRRAVQLDPHNIHYRIGLVSLLIQLHRDDEALRVLGSFQIQQVGQVTCCSCLNRVAALLRRCERTELAEACEQRVAKLVCEKTQRRLANDVPRES